MKFLADSAANWSDEYQLSDTANIMKMMTGAEYVPITHGDKTYCLFNNNADNFVGVLQFYENSGGATPPAPAAGTLIKMLK
jgi:hypothetical protein